MKPSVKPGSASHASSPAQQPPAGMRVPALPPLNMAGLGMPSAHASLPNIPALASVGASSGVLVDPRKALAQTPPEPFGRNEEVGALYRKLAALASERDDALARLERAHDESATADEQVGQMLASIAATEGRLRAAQKQSAAAEDRAHAAELRITELSGLVAKLRAEESSLDERASAAEARLAEEAEEHAKQRSAHDATARELEAARSRSDLARAELTEAEERIAALTTELGRRDEDRDAAQAVIFELEGIAEERDEALARLELAETHVRNSRNEAEKTRQLALSGESRFESELRDRASEVDRITAELAEEKARNAAFEREVTAARRAAVEERDAAAKVTEKTLAGVEHEAREAKRLQHLAEQETIAARGERDAHVTRAGELEAKVGALRTELDGVRIVLDATRAKLKTLAIEREMTEGLALQTRTAHEAEATRLNASASEALARSTEAMAMAEQFRSEMTVARRERDTATAFADRARRELDQLRSRVDPLRGEFNMAVGEASRGLAELEKRELEVTRLRASAIHATRELLDRAITVERALGAMLLGTVDGPTSEGSRSSDGPPSAPTSSPGSDGKPGSKPDSTGPARRRTAGPSKRPKPG